MNGEQVIDGFQSDDQSIANQQINAISPFDRDSLIADRQHGLCKESHSSFFKLDFKASLISRLQ